MLLTPKCFIFRVPHTDFSRPHPPENCASLDMLEEGDELWGTVSKLSNFGAYIAAGLEVEGFLHVRSWPKHNRCSGTEAFHIGERLRVWVEHVDLERKRIKLTGVRPTFLPTIGMGGEGTCWGLRRQYSTSVEGPEKSSISPLQSNNAREMYEE